MKRLLLIVALALAVGAGAFAATRAVRSEPVDDSSTQTLLNWLNVPSAQRQEILSHDPNFGADLKKLRDELAARRKALADALDNVSTPDEAITSDVEAVIAASSAVERRVTRYLLTVRDHLMPDQQRRLFSLCAEGVRQGPGWCGRRMGQGGGNGPGMGQGRGMGGGGGGRGFGPGARPTSRGE